jgi:hypothetical protein
VAPVTEPFIAMTLLLMWCECFDDGVEVEALLVTHYTHALALSLVLRISFRFAWTKFLASMSVIISTIVTLALAVITTNTIPISFVLSAISAS